MNQSLEIMEPTPDRCPACGKEIAAGPSLPAAETPCPHCGQPLWLVYRKIGEVVIVQFLPGRILKEAEFKFLREFLFSQSPAPTVLLNLLNCQYFSDTTLAGFIVLYKKLVEARGKLKICCLRSPMLDVFKLARLDQLFDIHDDEAAAMASF